MPRSFLAVEIATPICVRIAAAIGPLRELKAPISWVATANLHLTLKFLGEIENSLVADVASALESEFLSVSPFEIEIAGAGMFPDLEHPRVLWVGVSRGQEQIAFLAKRSDAALGALGFLPETRPFSAHVTVGRVRNGGQLGDELRRRWEALKDFQGGKQQVQTLNLDASELSPQGRRYTVMRTLALRRRNA